MSSKGELSEKMRRFAEFVVEGFAAVDAYAQSYAATNMNQATRRKRASELLKHPLVKAHIAELRAKASERAEITVAEVLRTLSTNLHIAMGDRTVKTKVLVRDRETGAVSVGEVEITDRDGGVVARTGDVLLKALGGYEIDHAQAAQAAAAARASEDVPSRDLARAVLDILRTAQLADRPPQESAKNTIEEVDEPVEDERDEETNSPSFVSTEVNSAAEPSQPSATLQVGEREIVGANGAEITWSDEFGRFSVKDGLGNLAGWRKDRESARALAVTLKPPPSPEGSRSGRT